MLSKSRRIERKYFNHILSHGKRYTSSSFLLYVAQIGQAGAVSFSKFSFSVSKKVSKLSVERNKLRRRGYSIIGKNIKLIKPGFFLLFSYKKGFQKDFKLIEREILELLSTALMIV